MNGCNQTRFTTTNIENGQFSDLVSAGKDRTQLKEPKCFSFIKLYQCWSAGLASGCFSANSFNRFRVMMCIGCPYVTYARMYALLTMPSCFALRLTVRASAAPRSGVGWKRMLASAPFHFTSIVTKPLEPHTWQYWGLHLPARRLQPSLEQPEDGQKGPCDELANFPLPARVPA